MPSLPQWKIASVVATFLAAAAILAGSAAFAVAPEPPVRLPQSADNRESATILDRTQDAARADLSSLDEEMLRYAEAAAAECAKLFEQAIDGGIKTEDEIFSTLYFPILPLASPPTFSTTYDDYVDGAIKPVEDRYLAQNPAIVFAVLVDRNGYLPSHNTKFSQPRTGDRELDLKTNRTKRIFNDVTGFRAAKNRDDYLLQVYRRDTGESMKQVYQR